MCGIIGILPRPSTRSVPTASSIEELLTAAVNAGTDCSLIADALMAADQVTAESIAMRLASSLVGIHGGSIEGTH